MAANHSPGRSDFLLSAGQGPLLCSSPALREHLLFPGADFPGLGLHGSEIRSSPGPLEPGAGCQQSGSTSPGGLWKSKVGRGTLSTSGASKCPHLPSSSSKSPSPGCKQKPFTREGPGGGLSVLFPPLVLYQNVFLKNVFLLSDCTSGLVGS